MLVLWGEKGKIGQWYDALAIWRQYCAADVTGHGVPSGHYLAEEAPDEVLRWLDGFLRRFRVRSATGTVIMNGSSPNVLADS